MKEDRLISIGEPVTARPKTYSTGSRGFYVWSKVTVDGKRYQLSGNLVEIGSKNASSLHRSESEKKSRRSEVKA